MNNTPENQTAPEAGLPGWLAENPRGQISLEQYTTLMRPINGTRVAKRSQGGKQLSYLEAWDVKAHLTRIFGFGNWDLEMLDYHHVTTRDYQGKDDKAMVEVIYAARMRLVIRDDKGREVCRHTEGAVGSTSGPDYLLGEHHDNALKTAASDATKRCAINLGSQFGLSLYSGGSTREVIKGTVIKPHGWETPELSDEQKEALSKSLGAEVIGQEPPVAPPADERPVQEVAAP